LLKTRISQIFSSQERWNIQIVRLDLDTEDLDEKEALEGGWLIWNDRWYNCRSVRLKLSEYVPVKVPSTITHEFTEDLDTISKIYKQFIEYKGYTSEFDIFIEPHRSKWLLLRDAGEPIAFTKLKQYDGGVESEFTSWNYHNPKMSIGKVIVNFEVEYAREMGYDYLYIGQGCERGSVYKHKFPGFEWWNGTEWSRDKDEYVYWCSRDSTINTLDQLDELYNAKVR